MTVYSLLSDQFLVMKRFFLALLQKTGLSSIVFHSGPWL